jgi:UDP-N-acetylglucosamine--N-acetylmuramyl-(pentapeptide) pyrophosphoryl-undecaprenol N-acetylglucosamine transferase
VIGVGGYSSFPVLKYAQLKRIPTFIHESNSLAGKSNILLGKKATKIFVGSAGMDKFFPADKLMITGNPVRKEMLTSVITRNEAIKFFELDEGKKTLLIVGGSLGAKSINEVIAAHIYDIEDLNIQLIWQTGSYQSGPYIQMGKAHKNVWVGNFIEKMGIAYAASDVVVSRAGAIAVAELCVAGKPVVFVPFPHAAEDHQTVNAQRLVDENAALMVKDAEAQSKLFSVATNLLFDTALQQQLKQHIKALAITNADEIIAKYILNSVI